jgi:DNA mismatch endonuclease (patch repair protein)
MADVHDKATRSKNMRAIGTRDTAIEKRLAGLLAGAGFSFTVQDAALPGRPDFVVADYQCVIFTHGCFWHHHDCYLFKVPATRTAFWLDKIAKNVARDRRDIGRLAEQGWRVLVVWECALRGRKKLNDDALGERLEEWICGGGLRADRYSGHRCAGRYFSALQDVISRRAGSRYLPSVTRMTAKMMIPSASHSTADKLSPAKPVPSSTATTGFT